MEPGGDLKRWGASTGFRVMGHGKVAAGKRVLIVEDELMIRMLLEGMLTDLGHSVAAEAGGLDEAISLAKQAEFDLAVLDERCIALTPLRIDVTDEPTMTRLAELFAKGM